MSKKVLVLGFLLLLNMSMHAQQKINETDRLIKIQRLLRIYDVLKLFSGVAVVAKDGVPLYKYTAGITNLDYLVPNSLTAQYNLFGISESFTALAVMQLVQQGKANLNAPLANYLPTLPVELKNITLKQLLAHSSGIKDYYKIPNYVANFLNITKISDLVELIANEPLQFAPDALVQRSSSNYVLLAAVVEKLSGKPYTKYLQDHIFAPAGMKNIASYYWYEIVFNKAVGYTFDENNQPISNAAFWGAYPFGADGIFGNAEEILLYVKALNDGKLLNKEQTETMFTALTDPQAGGYGLGWKVKRYNDSTKVVYQNGGVQGLSVFLSHAPKSKYTVVVFSNYNPNTAQQIGSMIDQALYTDDFQVPANAVAFQLDKLAQDFGFDYVIANFDELTRKNGVKIDAPWLLHGYGRDLMQRNEFAKAMDIFKINARKFPNDPVIYDGLGECAFKSNQPELAIRYFEDKLRIKPGDSYATTMLRVIKERR